MAGTIEINGTGGIIEGDLGSANVNVNLDSALSFDGTDDKIESSAAPRALVGSSNDFTISVWVKPDVVSGVNYYIVGAMESGAERFYLRIHDGQAKWGYGDTASSAAGAVSAGVWTHIALQYDVSDTQMKMFINGQLKNTATIAGKDITNTDNLMIGALNSNGSAANFFTGEIADVKIYNTEVSDADIGILASKIRQDPALTSAGTTNLRMWYKLGGTEASGSGNVPDDSPQSNTGTLTGTSKDYDAYSVDVYDNSTTTDGTFTVTQGKVEGLALSHLAFDGDDYVTLGSNSIGTNHTISAWVKVNNDGNNKTIFDFRDANNDGVLVWSTGSELLQYQLNSVDATSTSAHTVSWVHVIGCYDGTTQKLFINGVLDASNTTSQTVSVSIIR